MANAGRFQIRMGGPYPVWAEIVVDGKSVAHGIHHRELQDLEYAIHKAKKEARQLLGPKNQNEV